MMKLNAGMQKNSEPETRASQFGSYATIAGSVFYRPTESAVKPNSSAWRAATGYKNFDFSGFDIEITQTSAR